jgi:hypothetical protein
VKRIQQGTIAIAGATTTNTATISAVSLANTILLWAGTSTTDNTTITVDDGTFAHLTLTNATTVTATRGDAAFTTTIGYIVLEFFPGVIKSVQYGTMAGNGATATITTVNTLKSYVSCLGEYGPTADAAGLAAGFGTLTLTNATTVTSGGGTASSVIRFIVVEWF